MGSIVSNAFASFAGRLLASLKSRTSAHAENTTKVGNKTVAQVKAMVTKSSIGLPLVTNAPVATQAEAETGAAIDRYTTPLRLAQWIAKRFLGDSTVKGNSFCGLTPTGFSTAPLCQRMNIVTSAEEITQVQNYTESFSSVFNSWSRISHGSNGLFPSNSSELSSWNYDAATDKISCTVNSNTLVGFISPDSYDTFDFEVELSSTNTDDDWIGVVIAFTESDGKQYTLTLCRAWNSAVANAPNFILYYNLGQSDQQVIAGSMCGLGSPTTYHNSSGVLKNGWVGSGAVRFEIKRTGNAITCLTTNPGDTTTYLSAYQLTADLDSLDVLKRFKGPQRFGYCCWSQPYSTWKSLVRPGDKLPIIDSRNLDCYVFSNNAWTKQPAGSYQNYLAKNRLFTNQITGKLYFVGGSLNTIYPIVKGS